MTITIAAASTESEPGWGRLIALALVGLGFWMFTVAHRRWKEIRKARTKTTSTVTSSKPAAVTVNAVKPQVTATVDSERSTPGVSTAVAVRERAVAVASSPLDDFVAARLGRQSTTQIVRDATRELRVSSATAWRAVRKAKDNL